MLHVVPILCLLFFIGFIEIRLKNEINEIEEEFKKLKKRVKDLETTGDDYKEQSRS